MIQELQQNLASLATYRMSFFAISLITHNADEKSYEDKRQSMCMQDVASV